ncbi:DUF7716 domain-containing protein [Bradyrhizobium xenonodulans]
MDIDQIVSFQVVVATIMNRSPRAWVYLPSGRKWSLASESATLESDEVPPELEDEPDAWIPQFAKRHDLVQVMPVTTLQEIVSNARQQKPNATLDELFAAFIFYYKNDAFIEL